MPAGPRVIALRLVAILVGIAVAVVHLVLGVEALDEGRPLLSGLDPSMDAFSDIGLLATHFDLLDEQYPGSRFVLSVRPLEDWIDSRRRHVERNIARRHAGDYDGTFVVVDEDLWRQQWHRQVGRARRYFEGRRDFLEMDLTAGAQGDSDPGKRE